MLRILDVSVSHPMPCPDKQSNRIDLKLRHNVKQMISSISKVKHLSNLFLLTKFIRTRIALYRKFYCASTYQESCSDPFFLKVFVFDLSFIFYVMFVLIIDKLFNVLSHRAFKHNKNLNKILLCK